MSTDQPDAPAPKSKLRFLVPVAALLLGSAGAVAFTQPAALAQLAGGAPAGDEPEPIEFGVFSEMPGIVVNPLDTDGRRYLMVKLGIEAEDQKTLDRLDEMSPAVTDAVIGLMGGLRVEELANVARRDTLKEEIRITFNQMLADDGPVTRIYFTQYVLQ